MENWLQIKGFENYLVSDQGRIKSINPRKGSRANVNGGVISGWVQSVRGSYKRQMVMLRKDGKSYPKKVSILVLETFVSSRPHGLVCRHLDGDSLNNKLENLAWGSQKENRHDSVLHGTSINPPVHAGEKHHFATTSDEIVRMVRSKKYKRGEKTAMAKEIGVSLTTLNRWLNGDVRR